MPPIAFKDKPEGPTCDFCVTPDAAHWVYPCRPFTLAGIGWKSPPRWWSACDRCAEHIDSGQWRLLLNRAVETAVSAIPGEVSTELAQRIRHGTHAIQEGFYRNQDGPKLAWTAYEQSHARS